MRPVPIPDHIWKTAEASGGNRVIVGGPDGDPTGAVRPVEALVYGIVGFDEKNPDATVRALTVFHVAEKDDVEKFQAGGWIVITFLGDMVPYEVGVAPAAPAPVG